MKIILLTQNNLLHILAFACCLLEHFARIISEICALTFGYCICVSLSIPMLNGNKSSGYLINRVFRVALITGTLSVLLPENKEDNLSLVASDYLSGASLHQFSSLLSHFLLPKAVLCWHLLCQMIYTS